LEIVAAVLKRPTAFVVEQRVDTNSAAEQVDAVLHRENVSRKRISEEHEPGIHFDFARLNDPVAVRVAVAVWSAPSAVDRVSGALLLRAAIIENAWETGHGINA
jgi:hypothetical protein